MHPSRRRDSRTLSFSCMLRENWPFRARHSAGWGARPRSGRSTSLARSDPIATYGARGHVPGGRKRRQAGRLLISRRTTHIAPQPHRSDPGCARLHRALGRQRNAKQHSTASRRQWSPTQVEVAPTTACQTYRSAGAGSVRAWHPAPASLMSHGTGSLNAMLRPVHGGELALWHRSRAALEAARALQRMSQTDSAIARAAARP